ncbi:MAG: glycosyltransferase family 4 protein [Anaerolineae bacterium]|nr:glycosyltransferase family 4 protein [Anaerolineae bacterium]
MTHHPPLHIAINARISPAAGSGGVVTVLMGLIKALGELDDGPEQYILVSTADDSWLAPLIGPNQRIVRHTPPLKPPPSRSQKALNLAARLTRGGLRRVLRLPPRPPTLPRSDGLFEGLGCDLVHFPYQQYVINALPSIFQPWDLQHLHFPQFFSPWERVYRETVYRTGCALAHTVVVASHFMRKDLEAKYAVPPEKIVVIPPGPPLAAHRPVYEADLEATRLRYAVRQPFALYPAVSWPHKNHLRLLDALATLRDHDGLRLNLVCTGHQTPHFATIAARVAALKLTDQVCFTGSIPDADLSALYRLSDFVVFPSLFEGFGAPPLEAWAAGRAVASSGTSALGELLGDAALIFDPLSVESIADALRQMTLQPGLRADLAARGAQRLERYSWPRVARQFRAVYRRVAGQPLDDEDRALLLASG